MAVLLCISSLGAKPVESLPVLGENTKKAAATAENLARGENVFRQGREETPQEYRLETVECCKIETRQQRQLKRDKKILQRIVEAEAGGEDLDGKIMVTNVILNRVSSDQFPDNVTSVIWDRTGGSPQFSPTEDGRIYTVTVSDDTREAVNRAIDGDDLSQGALYFIAKDQADEKNVKWFDEKLTFLFAHGGHSFYI